MTPQDDFDRELARAATGSPEAIDALLDRYLNRLRAFIRLRMHARLRQYESCSDLVQSVCREVLTAQERFEFRGEAAFRSWLFTTALRKITRRSRYLTAQRRDRDRQVLAADLPDYDQLLAGVSPEHSPSTVAMAAEHAERLEQAFDRLPDDYREVITLARVAELPLRDVAHAMERSEGATRMLLNRALVQLARELDRDEGGPA